MTSLIEFNYKLGFSILFLISILFVDLSAQNPVYSGADVLTAKFEGKTKPLSELIPKTGTDASKRNDQKANRPSYLPPNFIGRNRFAKTNPDALPKGEDPVRQKTINRFSARIVNPTVVIEGISASESNSGVPDTNGEAGPDHYIEIVNASFLQIFNKDGSEVTGAISANTIWSQIGHSSFSDPIIQYDEAAQRWLLTDLASISRVLYGVSETTDPMGAWFLYTFEAPGFADYPKYGIWPNSYILTINEGQGVFPVYALNRQQMLAGESDIDIQRLDIPNINGAFPTLTPMDWNSPMAPPSDEVFAVRMNDDAWGNGNNVDLVEIWKMNVDWDTPANTTFSSIDIPVAAFDSDGCALTGGFQCIPQPGTNQGIDGIMTIVMNNVAYWNYGTHESAVITFSVDAGNDIAGIRWMEMRRTTSEDWSLYQEGTYAPVDGDHRFIPSISINSKGDIGLAYSVSSENTFPSLRFTGRQNSDPLGMMTVDEYEFATGLSSNQQSRFGDYAKMSIDPIDDSFWFSGEYMLAGAEYGTKIVNFEITPDTFDIAATRLITPLSAADLSDQETVEIEIKNVGLEPATEITVGYQFGDGPVVVEPALIDTLFVDSIYVHTFPGSVDMSDIGDYDFTIFTNFVEDQQLINDTLDFVRSNLPHLDAGVSDVLSLDFTQCGTSTVAQASILNYGQDTLRSANIIYSLNAGAESTLEWTGELAFGESELIDLSIDNLIDGINNLSVRTESPNQAADQVVSNDSYSIDFDASTVGLNYRFELVSDFPDEASWLLIDSNMDTLYLGEGGSTEPFETIVQEWCLLEGQCYTFFMIDSYGDGLTSYRGDGSYNIYNEDNEVVASTINVAFGFIETNPFCVNIPCNIEATVDVTEMINDDQGAILISVTSGVSPFLYSINNGVDFQDEPLFEGLIADTYQVVVTDANNCSWSQEVVVDRIVATSDVNSTTQISILPNPSKDGLFHVKIEGVELKLSRLDYQVITSGGKTLLHSAISSFNGNFEGLISLHKYAPGVYYIRFKNDRIHELLKVVRL